MGTTVWKWKWGGGVAEVWCVKRKRERKITIKGRNKGGFDLKHSNIVLLLGGGGVTAALSVTVESLCSCVPLWLCILLVFGVVVCLNKRTTSTTQFNSVLYLEVGAAFFGFSLLIISYQEIFFIHLFGCPPPHPRTIIFFWPKYPYYYYYYYFLLVALIRVLALRQGCLEKLEHCMLFFESTFV